MQNLIKGISFISLHLQHNQLITQPFIVDHDFAVGRPEFPGRPAFWSRLVG